MNLENTVKYHFAKSTLISDSPRATASDSLSGTDIMAAMGMTQERAAMGYLFQQHHKEPLHQCAGVLV